MSQQGAVIFERLAAALTTLSASLGIREGSPEVFAKRLPLRGEPHVDIREYGVSDLWAESDLGRAFDGT